MTGNTAPARSFGSFHTSNIEEQLQAADVWQYVVT